MSAHPWPRDTNGDTAAQAAVRELVEAGLNVGEIAERLNIDRRTVQRHRHNAGLSKPPPKWLTPDQVAWAKAAIEDGCPANEVARTLGCNPRAIHDRFPSTLTHDPLIEERPLIRALGLEWR